MPERKPIMKLFYNPPSPYARKVLVHAHELDLMGSLILIPVDPWKDPPELIAATPLAKVPTLLTDDGVTLTESTAICEFFSRLAGVARPDGDAWLDLASRTGLAQGLTDASFGLVVEGRRPAETRWTGWQERLTRAMDRAIKVVRTSKGDFDIGDASLACALAYMDFRLADVPWRARRPDLARWLDEVNQRPSMIATRP